MFGVAGAIVGASTASTTQKVDSIYIKITTNNFNRPVEKIIISRMTTDRSSAYYKSCVDKANEVIGLLTAIQANA